MTVVWDDDAEKRVAVFVPFGCELNAVRAERELSSELATIAVNAPK